MAALPLSVDRCFMRRALTQGALAQLAAVGGGGAAQPAAAAGDASTAAPAAAPAVKNLGVVGRGTKRINLQPVQVGGAMALSGSAAQADIRHPTSGCTRILGNAWEGSLPQMHANLIHWGRADKCACGRTQRHRRCWRAAGQEEAQPGGPDGW